MNRRFKTRRDMVFAIGHRAVLLDDRQAATAWHTLALHLEALGDADIPKFRDVIQAIRAATIIAKKPNT